MYISFENDLGKLDLNGRIWRIKQIEGLGLIEKTYSIVTYPDIDGQELLSAVTHSRVITMSGDFLMRGNAKNELGYAMKIFNKPGVLKIHVGSKKRKISCRCTSFSAEQSDRNAVFQPFVLQLTADFPFFEDFDSKKIALFLRENQIRNEFTLPCIFTTLVSRRNIVNSGDEATVPTLNIICNKVGLQSENYGIEIINHTTGQVFKLLYKPQTGEEITVDFKNRTVTSNLPTENNNSGNLIVYMSNDTFLSNFYFDVGINDIECLNYDTDGEISVIAEYTDKFIEAVI